MDDKPRDDNVDDEGGDDDVTATRLALVHQELGEQLWKESCQVPTCSCWLAIAEAPGHLELIMGIKAPYPPPAYPPKGPYDSRDAPLEVAAAGDDPVQFLQQRQCLNLA